MALGVANLPVYSYLSDLNRRRTKFQRLIVGRIAEVEDSSLPLCAFLRPTLVEVLVRISLDRMVTSCRSRGALLRVPMSLVMALFSFGILRLRDLLDVDMVLVLFAITRVRDVDGTALSDQSWFPYKYRDGVLIVIKPGAPFKRVYRDVSKKWHDGEDEVCPVNCKEFESRDMTKEFAKAAWFPYLSDEDNFYE